MTAMTINATVAGVARLLQVREDRYHVRQDRTGPFRVVDATTEDGIFQTTNRALALDFCRQRNYEAGGPNRCALDGRCDYCAGAGLVDGGAYDRLGNWMPDRLTCPACLGAGRKLFLDSQTTAHPRCS
jgi:hypothetical protein